MEGSNDEPQEQEVTVEVLPDTVTEIIYLPEGDLLGNEQTYYVPSEEEVDTEETTEYEIGSVDTTRLPNRDLVLDQTETFVFLSAENELINPGTVFLQQIHEERQMEDEEEEEEEEEVFLDESFDCTKCDFKSSLPDALKEHQLIHKVEQTCGTCGKSFPKANLLSRHHKEEHTTYACKVCNIEFIGRKSYVSHVRHHDHKKYVCYTCSAKFTSGVKLMNHMETHGTVLLYACNKCDEAFSSTLEVSTHLRHVHSSRNKVHGIQPTSNKFTAETVLPTDGSAMKPR